MIWHPARVRSRSPMRPPMRRGPGSPRITTRSLRARTQATARRRSRPGMWWKHPALASCRGRAHLPVSQPQARRASPLPAARGAHQAQPARQAPGKRSALVLARPAGQLRPAARARLKRWRRDRHRLGQRLGSRREQRCLYRDSHQRRRGCLDGRGDCHRDRACLFGGCRPYGGLRCRCRRWAVDCRGGRRLVRPGECEWCGPVARPQAVQPRARCP